jgi:sugar phosphate isomerase/epimerase
MSEISRRRVLQAGAAIMVSSGLGCTAESRNPLGIQLYTLRDEMAKSVSATFQRLAQIGYSELEFAGYFDHDAKETRKLLDDNGLTAPSSHVPLERMQSAPEKTIEIARTVGHQYLVVPWLAEELRQSIDQYRQTAETLNRIGEKCKAAGLTFAYHNHAFEFDVIGGQIPYDVLLSETDPNLVAMEMDVYWVTKAGQSPSQYINDWPGRFPLWHIKDISSDGTMVDVGDGVIDFAALFEHRERSGLQHGFVEHDRPEDAFRTAERSYGHLANKW